MTTIAVVARTPYYVLMDGPCRIGPRVMESPSESDCAPIYGFSDRGAYETFCANCHLALRPYPLVTAYLRNQDCASGDRLKLVVLDAAGPREQCLHAATVQAVLEAHENRTKDVIATCRLTFDQETDAYKVEEASV